MARPVVGQPRAFDPGRLAAYWPAARAAARLLGTLDREPDSPSYGSFDREHWGWKFRDFPVTMLQVAALPLALLWRHPLPDNPYHRNPRLLGWLKATLEVISRRQRPNGAFDSVGPYTQDHGVTLAMAYVVVETLGLLADSLPRELADTAREAVRRGCEFALRSREDYAFISNHQALFALAFLSAAERLGEPRYRRRAESVVDEILRRQSPDGWYREYGGPDPGYESLGIHYLAAYWQRTGSERLLASLRRSVEFYAHCLHPDGSLGGVYGSRHTQLYFPSGFERLSADIPLAGAVARFMRERLGHGNVLTPDVSDAENLAPLIQSYLDACLLGAEVVPAETPPLPLQVLRGLRHFPDSGISVAWTSRYYAVINAAKGGVLRAFDRRAGRLAYQDAGYLVRAEGRRWSSQVLGLGRRLPGGTANEIVVLARLAEVRQELPTPLRFVILRLLNLTLFRSLTLGAWLRRLIIRRLITGARPGPLRLRRLVRFEEEYIRVADSLEAPGPLRVDAVTLPREFTAFHMGSAKYFHPADLRPIPAPAVGGMREALRVGRSARCDFVLQFPLDAEPRIGSGTDDQVPRREAATG